VAVGSEALRCPGYAHPAALAGHGFAGIVQADEPWRRLQNRAAVLVELVIRYLLAHCPMLARGQPMPRKASKYGTPHQKLRAQLVARWRPGDPCARCGKPMMTLYRVSAATGRRVAAVQLGHRDGGTGWTGLEHSECNMSAGGIVGTSRQGKKSRQRSCPICHVGYKASRTDQIACCREHADAFKRGDAPWPVSGRAW
jgi:hypothetical protein